MNGATYTGFCDQCCEEREDVVTCECSITRCVVCREDGCRRCDQNWTDRYWRGN